LVSFEMTGRDGLARLGILRTPHGAASTPALMPVIHPGIQTIPPLEMRQLFGAEIVITNSYIIRGREEFREKALKEGLGKLIGWDGPVMTDSGTFQSYMYGEVEVSQLEILDFQRRIGSDLCTMLDIFSTPEATEAKAAAELAENGRRAREASELFHGRAAQGAAMAPAGARLSRNEREEAARGGAKGGAGGPEGQGLVLAVQGGVFPHLRERSARDIAGLECAVQAVGGVAPLMESYRYQELVEAVLAAKRGLDPSRPVHLFGAGHPMMFALAALMGCDLFDSSSYAKYAKDGRMMFNWGTRHLDELEHLPCNCPVCSSTDPERLRALPEEERVRKLAEHNLHASFAELRRVRQAISEMSLWELVEERCRGHPALLSALHSLDAHAGWLERFAPASRPGAFFYKGPESSFRPEVVRWSRRLLERYSIPESAIMVCLPEAPKPYSRHYRDLVAKVQERWDARFVVASFFGPVPLELDGMYPVAQSLVPGRLDPESVERLTKAMKAFSHKLRSEFSIVWEGEPSFSALEMMAPPRSVPVPDWELLRVRATCELQFGRAAADAVLAGRLELVLSPNTGRVRNVLADGEHRLSLRARDGLFTLKPAGARRMLRAVAPPGLRVAVDDDAAAYAAKGKNVFSRFVRDCDPELRPGEEVAVVDGRDRLVACGRALMVRDEMLAFRRGVAVRVRQGVEGAPGAGAAEEDDS
jgi:7-cyano-7-deazaguanine tRNA-ribosyltransferase